MQEGESIRMKNGKYLRIGIIAAIITVLGGELPLGWYIKPAINNLVQAQIEGYASVSLLQLACGIFFGGLGIAFQSFGYEAIGTIISETTSCRKTAKLTHIGALFCGMFGPIVHILAIVLMYVCKSGNIDEIMRVALYFVIPITLVFMPVYMAMMISIFIAVIRGNTELPMWSAFINPAIIMGLVNGITFLMGNSYISNSVQMANMGFGSLITFLYWDTAYKRRNISV